SAAFRRFSFGARHFRANHLFTLFFGTLAFRDVVAGEDSEVRTEFCFGPCDEPGSSIFRLPVILSLSHFLPGSGRKEERRQRPSVDLGLRVTEGSFEGTACTHDSLRSVHYNHDAIG